MKWNSAFSELKRAHLAGRFAEFIRGSLDSVTGYLLEDSFECALINHFEWNAFDWNGKCIVAKRTITDLHCFRNFEWPMKAARHFGVIRPVTPKSSRKTAAEFFNKHLAIGSIIQVEQEVKSPGQMFLCELLAIGPKGMALKSYDRTLKETEDLTLPYEDITLITFQDRYSKAATHALGKMGYGARLGQRMKDAR